MTCALIALGVGVVAGCAGAWVAAYIKQGR